MLVLVYFSVGAQKAERLTHMTIILRRVAAARSLPLPLPVRFVLLRQTSPAVRLWRRRPLELWPAVGALLACADSIRVRRSHAAASGGPGSEPVRAQRNRPRPSSRKPPRPKPPFGTRRCARSSRPAEMRCLRVRLLVRRPAAATTPAASLSQDHNPLTPPPSCQMLARPQRPPLLVTKVRNNLP